jgi:hypothetical protein
MLQSYWSYWGGRSHFGRGHWLSTLSRSVLDSTCESFSVRSHGSRGHLERSGFATGQRFRGGLGFIGLRKRRVVPAANVPVQRRRATSRALAVYPSPSAATGCYPPEEFAMNTLHWMIGKRLITIARREYDLVFNFDGDVSLVVEHLWRLLESGRIRRTGEDHGHQFGFPAPVDAVAELRKTLTGVAIAGVEVQDGTLDLRLKFETAHVLEVLPTSAGYESWHLSACNKTFIATSGGELAIFEDKKGG